jgi:hypothetical protein
LALFVFQAFLQPLYFVSKPSVLTRCFFLVLSDLPLPLLHLQVKRLLLLLKLFDLTLRQSERVANKLFLLDQLSIIHECLLQPFKPLFLLIDEVSLNLLDFLLRRVMLLLHLRFKLLIKTLLQR